MKDNSLVQFVRDRKGQPRGLVVATVIDNEIRIGWSFTNTKAGDRFDKTLAYKIALGRAETGQRGSVVTPHSVSKVVDSIMDRAVRYYKGTPVSSVVNSNFEKQLSTFCEDCRGE